MKRFFKTKKSAGVRVSRQVYGIIKRANVARESKDWAVAATLFERAVREDASLYHIWMQLGHARKEICANPEAEGAYLQAASRRPEAAEPFLHLGHLYKRLGAAERAGYAYLRAARLAPGDANVWAELRRLLPYSSGLLREEILLFVREQLSELNDDQTASSAPSAHRIDCAPINKCRFVFDVSDLISYFDHARLPTGIQRVQIEVITKVLVAADNSVGICCFVEAKNAWLEVPPTQFLKLADLSLCSGDSTEAIWLQTLNKLHLTLLLGEPFPFPQGAFLINLGTSWWLQNYFLHIREIQKSHGIRYVPFVHDLIPIIMPDHCTDELTRDFISWAIGVFAHATLYFVNSEATKTDLLSVAETLGYRVNPDDIIVAPLGADFRKPGVMVPQRSGLRRLIPAGDKFVLFVATIESRKGHIVAFDAWIKLINRYGEGVPRLVCVGNNGWLNDAVFQLLKDNDKLADRVTMLSHLSDADLALLYSNCLFTIYPSSYEGWGLPVTESLCYGKAVITTDSASLPEAGGKFARYVKYGSSDQLARAIEEMAYDDRYRANCEQQIAEQFKPRTWQDITEQIREEIRAISERLPEKSLITIGRAEYGLYYPIRKSSDVRIWPGAASGEIFRTGVGWHLPDIDGCWTRQSGGEIAIGLPKQQNRLQVFMRLKNIPNEQSSWNIDVAGGPLLHGVLNAGEERWISFNFTPAVENDVLQLSLKGDVTEDVMVTGGKIAYGAAVGLCGFFLCEAGDQAARHSLLEAVTLGNVLNLDAYRKPD